MANHVFICTVCGKRYSPDEAEYLCPEHPEPGILKTEYDYEVLKKVFSPPDAAKHADSGLERYSDLLPLQSAESLPPLKIGPTPLAKAERLREKLSLPSLYLKDDTCLPTASFKDRASALVVAKARELGKEVVVTASTGNAAVALAGLSASVGLPNIIFVPERAPIAKLTQIAAFGARLIPVKGTYDDAYELSIAATENFGWYNRNTGYNPFTIEGKKTAALEIWEQLGFQAPDKVLIPTGDAVILSGTYKGFYDLQKLGLIDKIPQIIAVQAQGSAAIANALERGEDVVTPLEKSTTIADSISVARPACGNWALKIIRETNGFALKVTDEEIIAAIKELASFTGIFAEPAAAASYAGLLKGLAEHKIDHEEVIVLLITGSGLKDISVAAQAVKIPSAIACDLAEVEKYV